jgi:hypothetical protein
MLTGVKSFGNDFDFQGFLKQDDYALQSTFQNLNSLNPHKDGVVLSFFDGASYKRECILDLCDKLNDIVGNVYQRGLLTLQLGHMFLQSQGYEPIAREIETNGLSLLQCEQRICSSTISTGCPTLLGLCSSINVLLKSNEEDIYGFCLSKDYYIQLLQKESKKLGESLRGYSKNWSEPIVQTRQLLRGVLFFLGHNKLV